MTLTISGLEWQGGPWSYEAMTPFSDGIDEWSVYVVEFDSGKGHWGMWPPGCSDDPKSWHSSEDTAFAAAQADYTARIIAVLDPARLAALEAQVKAADGLAEGAQATLDAMHMRLNSGIRTPVKYGAPFGELNVLTERLTNYRTAKEAKP